MARAKTPVTIAGIEFDALIDATKTMNATIPMYPVEDGFPVSDTIILEPLQLSMTLYVSNTPVTWLKRHGSSMTRIDTICNRIEALWESKSLVKIVTSEAIYTNMGITGISIKKSKELGYAREIQLTCQKVRTTSKSSVSIPSYSLKSGTTGASGGSASTTTEGSSTSSAGSAGSSDSSASGSASGDSASGSKKQSILYGIGTGLGLIS